MVPSPADQPGLGGCTSNSYKGSELQAQLRSCPGLRPPPAPDSTPGYVQAFLSKPQTALAALPLGVSPVPRDKSCKPHQNI